MIRSTRTQKADRLKAARRLFAAGIGMAEAAMTLSREYGLSRRQAYRYLELVRASRAAAPVTENSITITLKMPESLAGDLRAYASKHDLTTSEVIRRAVSAFLAAKRQHG